MSMDREAIEALRIMLTAHPVGHTLTEEDESMDGLYNELCDLALEGLAQPEGGFIKSGSGKVARTELATDGKYWKERAVKAELMLVELQALLEDNNDILGLADRITGYFNDVAKGSRPTPQVER
jgi:hypothetical protein